MLHLFLGGLDQVFLDLGHDHVEDTDGDTTHGGIVVAQGFNFVQDCGCFGYAAGMDGPFDDLGQLFLADHEITFKGHLAGVIIPSFHETQVLRNNAVEDEAAQG